MPADTPTATTGAAAGVIHDLGYRRYDGPRLGRAQMVRALVWHSFRSAFGFGRGAKAKIVPVIAFVVLALTGVGIVAGLVFSASTASMMASLLYGVRPMIRLCF